MEIHDNLIQGNLSNDDGGGIRLLRAGTHPIRIYNNLIVNNVATDLGGGIALDDASDVAIFNNDLSYKRFTVRVGAGGWTYWNGSTYLGRRGELPVGVTSFNRIGEEYFILHSHSEFQMTNWGEQPRRDHDVRRRLPLRQPGAEHRGAGVLDHGRGG